MMNFCAPNITIVDFSVNYVTSQCFMESAYAGILFGFLLIFGTIQLYYYKKYGLSFSEFSRRTSKLFFVQIALIFFLIILTIARFVIQYEIINPGIIYGYQVFSTVGIVLALLFSLKLIFVERNMLLPSTPSRGHGLVLLLFWMMLFLGQNLMFVNLSDTHWWFQLKTDSDKIEMGLFIGRYILCSIIFILGLRAPGVSHDYSDLNNGSPENQQYGPASDSNRSAWYNAFRKLKRLFPFLWPKHSCMLQFRVIFCFFLLISGRFINLYVPIIGEKIVDSMTIAPIQFRWDFVLIFAGLKILQGGGSGGAGLLNNFRSFLWIRVQQYTTREVEVTLFNHLHTLSLRWHLNRKTGEVLRSMDRGAESINSLLSYILFNITPTLVDILIAVIYFISAFNAWFGLIVFVTMILYLGATIWVTEWRTKFQRRMNLADNAAQAQNVDSLLNFETVKYYGAEDFEVARYQNAVLKFQEEEWKSVISLYVLNTVQNFIICGGLFVGTLLCVHKVTVEHTLTVGQYFLFSNYIFQLYVPLNYFGTFYRAIQKSFVDMENMLDLMHEEPEILDAPGAPPLIISEGQVDFKNVSFSYIPERPILKNINFSVKGGKTIALVGPSGSGKSTIIRLLFRFYDVESGAILIDGQNIKTVTQSSLRKAIGVVPQDTVLFNDTIRYNIAYGKVSSEDADVVAAAQNAEIHERILTFPDGYETLVGERGLKLSGGEKQRVAIARTMLKSPSVILLDEATSALDTQTERNIQAALAKICANKTTLVVAHRLSTVVNADEILVLKEGEIVERGRHEELLNQNGVYAAMWEQQLKNVTEPNTISMTSSSSSVLENTGSDSVR